MAIPKKTPVISVITDKTPAIAQEIYDMIIVTQGVTGAFKAFPYPMQHIKAVYAEIKRMEQVAITLVQAHPDCTAAQVITAIASNWLDDSTVGGDILRYNPTWDENRTFEEFKAEYSTEG